LHEKLSLPPNLNKVAVAFSGGTDSLSLLLALRERIESKNIYVLHVDHQVRDPKSCDKECDFVFSISKELGIKLVSEKLPRLERSSEDLLRTMRYEKLVKMAQENEVEFVALGHHKLDQSESFMLHLLRGCNLKGLSGMRESFEIDGISFIRPMLNINRHQLKQYIKKKGFAAFEDPSNAENVYKRNRIRNELFPLIENLQPGVGERLAEFTNSFKEIELWLSESVNELEQNLNVKTNIKGEILIPKSGFKKIPIPVIKEWCYKKLSIWAGGYNKINRTHVDSLYKALHSEITGYWPECFPGNVQIRVRKREIVIKSL
jgi:tRNA(Ile)-lysidine synthase